ncbi:ParA family protein [Cellulomonas marina]|uniref:AAA domain-containing protein n=1 Tax=Cellulomonas marina TaxID=988821 RepID=A0A1I1A071_9CELL|nr:AAA family ATPase [Cellulomonas marina]GIG29394.1 phage-related regulatory protein [Cellulomonas marina]SFB29793.1 AAA domain-containing protein [Cellulomonas marina]
MDIISFFNHKGGVGKTTLLFNVAIALGRTGKRVLLVDADAQTNLTGTAIDAVTYEDIVERQSTSYHALVPVIQGSGEPRELTPAEIRDNVWILPGHIRLSEYEETLSQAWTDSLAGRYQGFQRTTALQRMILQVASSVEADVAFVDVGPSVGPLNRVVLLGSSGFVLPLAPDLFSLTALPSVGRSLADWIAEWKVALSQGQRTGVLEAFPEGLFTGTPSPLGYVSQQFASYRSAPAAAFQRWLDDIPTAYHDSVVEKLRAEGVATPSGPGEIGTVRNLSSLVPMAQEANAAIFELSGSEARGSQYTRARDTESDFQQLALTIMARLGEVQSPESVA